MLSEKGINAVIKLVNYIDMLKGVQILLSTTYLS